MYKRQVLRQLAALRKLFQTADKEVPTVLQQAIDRSDNNKVALQRLYISIGSEKFDDRELALAYLEQERDQAANAELKNALQRNIGRLQGLVLLDKAQAEFERKFNRPLANPKELIEHGIISAFPTDPLRIGYEFRDNAFHYRQLRINQSVSYTHLTLPTNREV